MKEDGIEIKKLNLAIALVAELYELDAEKLKQADKFTVIRALTRHGWRWNGSRWHLPQRDWMKACAVTPKPEKKPERQPKAEKSEK